MTTSALLLVLMGCGLGLGLSTFWIPRKPAPDLLGLEERLRHARNLSMRLSELAEKQSRLSVESRHLEHHLSLKEGVSWMLTQVHERMDSCRPSTSAEESERMEELLSATCKSLRCLLEAGSSPLISLEDLHPMTRTVHRTLCLLQQRRRGSVLFADSVSTEFQIDAIYHLQLLFQLCMNHKLPEHVVMQASHHGLSMKSVHGNEVAFYPWVRVPA